MRHNIFNKAHLPLKNALISGCISISDAVNQEGSSATEALKKIGEVLHIFKEQTQFESGHILPFVFEYEPSVWCSYASEHDKATRLAQELQGLIGMYYQQQKTGDKLRTISLIMNSYNEFMLFNFNHMDDEEAVLNEMLWRYYQDHVLLQIEEKIEIMPHLVNQRKPRRSMRIAAAA